jgi:hypothetical protein
MCDNEKVYSKLHVQIAAYTAYIQLIYSLYTAYIQLIKLIQLYIQQAVYTVQTLNQVVP